MIELNLACPACGSSFERLWSKAEGQVSCPNCGAPVCPCGCGADLSENRAGALYHSEACRKRLERAQNPDITRTGIRSGNVRSVQEADALHETFKDQWRRRILRRILHALDSKGEYHADDCADLPVPAEHVNLIGSQVMRLKNAGAIEKTGSRRNSARASNSRWSGVYRYAEGGRAKALEIAGLNADRTSKGAAGLDSAELPVSPAPISVQPGESGAGVPTAQAPGGASHDVPLSASTASPDSSTGDHGEARGGSAEGEPADEVSGAAQLFDLDDARLAPPRSALTDPRAA